MTYLYIHSIEELSNSGIYGLIFKRAHPDISIKTVCYKPGNLHVFRRLGLAKMVCYNRKFVISEYVLSDGIIYKIKKESAGDFRFSSLLPIIRYKRVCYKWSQLYIGYNGENSESVENKFKGSNLLIFCETKDNL
jgi:hypothetical protein